MVRFSDKILSQFAFCINSSYIQKQILNQIVRIILSFTFRQKGSQTVFKLLTLKMESYIHNDNNNPEDVTVN